jgi:hypothetical protein
MKRKKLLELYRIKEGQFDDINKSLGSAQSVAADPRAKGGQQKPSSDPRVAKAQGSLDKSKSIFDESAGDFTLSLTRDEIISISTWADEYQSDSIKKKINDLMGWDPLDNGQPYGVPDKRYNSPAEYEADFDQRHASGGKR